MVNQHAEVERDRPLWFFENGILQAVSIDLPPLQGRDSPEWKRCGWAAPGAGIQSQDFFTVSVQRFPRVDRSESTVLPRIQRSIPQTHREGLLDTYLFRVSAEGASAGRRCCWSYVTLAEQKAIGRYEASWNQLYGAPRSHALVGSARTIAYSKLNSAFGSVSYESISFRAIFMRPCVGNSRRPAHLCCGHEQLRSHFVTGKFEAALGPALFSRRTDTTWNRPVGSQNYDQWLFTFGYRSIRRTASKWARRHRSDALTCRLLTGSDDCHRFENTNPCPG